MFLQPNSLGEGMVDPRGAQVRAKSVAESVFERQYSEGIRTIQGADWASDIYNLILNECPHVPEEEVVRLFRRRNAGEAESVLGEALFREYNATHSRRFR
jgi:hypothetical protein